jgi:2-polyprenyl-3-methyl-5-hydroxy-6-metoxy-1,4-benzoquinol methylase
MVRGLKSAGRRAYEAGARLYLGPLLRREWRYPPIQELREYVFQFEFAMRAVARHMPRELLDAGSGMSAWPHLLAECGVRVTATDEMRSYWGSMFNRHYHVIQDDLTASRLDRRFDMVTCLGVLTTIADDRPAVRNLFRLVRPGGHLVLTFAYKEDEAVPNAYVLPGATYGAGARYICRMFSRAEVDAWLAEEGGAIEEQEYFQVFTGPYWASGERLEPPRRVGVDEPHQYTALSIQVGQA